MHACMHAYIIVDKEFLAPLLYKDPVDWLPPLPLCCFCCLNSLAECVIATSNDTTDLHLSTFTTLCFMQQAV